MPSCKKRCPEVLADVVEDAAGTTTRSNAMHRTALNSMAVAAPTLVPGTAKVWLLVGGRTE